ncbi:MAG: 16S rRNA (uracil(1498)-N(3))-methyltransferase [Breznakibacter sp.]|nr:16S rRNA (uracil(1498)-N(3))-methyltransferase [Breznakibacter sp.]
MELLFDASFMGSGVLCEDESRHAISVLRHKENDVLNITNGKGELFESRIIRAHHKKCELELIQTHHWDKPTPWLHMAVAPTKNIDRFEWFLEKATELGIQEITPIICDHSERDKIRLDRMEKVLVAAMKQSLKYWLPILNEPTSLAEFIARPSTGTQKFILHCREAAKMHLFNATLPQQDSIVLIGPEGDFSVREIEMARANQYMEATLGDNRLRTETAALAACHIANLKNDIGNYQQLR